MNRSPGAQAKHDQMKSNDTEGCQHCICLECHYNHYDGVDQHGLIYNEVSINQKEKLSTLFQQADLFEKKMVWLRKTFFEKQNSFSKVQNPDAKDDAHEYR